MELAERFLQEAVFRSRERQAVGSELRRGASPGAGNCGLGEKAAVELDLSARGRELAAQLWPAGLEGARLDALKALVADWIVEQDALDRKRNHFIKAFRQKHGFDRMRWSREQSEEFDFGLAKINAGEDDSRRRAAGEMLQLELG